jgi:hypothetical protein
MLQPREDAQAWLLLLLPLLLPHSCRVGIVSIANSAFSVNGGTMMAHAGNVVVALLQITVTRLPIVSYHFQVSSQMGHEVVPYMR